MDLATKEKTLTRYLLLDADTFVYRSAIRSETKIEWDPGLFTMDADLGKAKESFKECIQDHVDAAQEYLDPGDNLVPVICLTDLVLSYRKDLEPGYKGKRGERPFIYHELRQWVEDFYPAWGRDTLETTICLRPRLEADDLLGILATLDGAQARRDIMFSEDKDLWQIPGLHMTKNGLEDVTPEAGNRFFYTQVLTGDAVDSYPGCPGIGPVTAEKILAACQPDAKSYWAAVVKTYESKKLTEADAVHQARQAKILQSCDYDFKKKEPILWTPPIPASP